MAYFHQLKVVELAQVLAGPAVGQFFAEMGATVIKVEPPGRGDVTRTWKTPHEEADAPSSAYFYSVNWGKSSIAIDLSKPEGREILHRILADADVLLVSFKPESAAQLGMDYPSLRISYPELIYAHITAYGMGNSRPGLDALLQAESGFMSINGMPEGPPLKMPVALIDMMAALQLRSGILAALLERTISGKGQYVAVSLWAAALTALANQGSNFLNTGVTPKRMGNAHPNIVPYGTLFRCADDTLLMVAVGNDNQFAALCQVLDKPAMAYDKRWATNAARVAHSASCIAELSPAFQQNTADYWQEQCLLAGVPAGRVRTVPEALQDRAAAPFILQSVAEGMRGLRVTAFQSPAKKLTPPPRAPGANTEEILQWLGYLPTQVKELNTRGVIG